MDLIDASLNIPRSFKTSLGPNINKFLPLKIKALTHNNEDVNLFSSTWSVHGAAEASLFVNGLNIN